MNLIDLNYAGYLSVRLERYRITHQSPYRANFRCPLCGDSQKSKTKTRGWLLESKSGGLVYYCHNCGANMPLRAFLEIYDESLYDNYIVDRKLDNVKSEELFTTKTEPEETKEPTIPLKSRNSFLKKIKKVSQLKHDHPVKKYLTHRQIPTNVHYKLYFARDFNAWVNEMIPEKLPKTKEPRLVIPFLDENGNMFGFTGRSFKKDGLRYITIMLDDTKDKIYGLDTVDFKKPYYVVEGSIDSFFLPNSIAMAGADLNIDALPNLENATFVMDNEPRNKEILKRMEKLLDKGQRVCFWPNTIKQKDINDMVIAGITMGQIKTMIDDNTYKGLRGKLKLSDWRKA